VSFGTINVVNKASVYVRVLVYAIDAPPPRPHPQQAHNVEIWLNIGHNVVQPYFNVDTMYIQTIYCLHHIFPCIHFEMICLYIIMNVLSMSVPV